MRFAEASLSRNIDSLPNAAMHILITNNSLADLAGSELYVQDLALELQKKGHRVTCFTLRPGIVSQRLQALGIGVACDVEAIPEDIDVIHAHHPLETMLAAARLPLVPLIYVSHGITHPLERPSKSEACVTRYIAVSEDVQRHLVGFDGISEDLVEIIPNFVDTDRFSATRPIRTKPETVLVVSNHYGLSDTRATIERACEIAGNLELRVIGSTTQSVWNVEDYIDWADVVITLGRGALQAMAMGRAVVIYDYRGGDGLVTPDNFPSLAGTNFSGRTFAHNYSSEQLAEEILRYDLPSVMAIKELVVEKHSVSYVTECLLKAYDRAAMDFRESLSKSSETWNLKARLRSLANYSASLKQTNVEIAERAWLRERWQSSEEEVTRSHRRIGAIEAENELLKSNVLRLEELYEKEATEFRSSLLELANLANRLAAAEMRNQQLADALFDANALIERIASGRVMRLMNAVKGILRIRAGRPSKQ